mmetsp:Transcript_71159/g.157059  ORF Transcript_71159/g.157059 Transcript_71159/m.157059 type:complete len:98 (+) Transcript_71159:827-1120(+)
MILIVLKSGEILALAGRHCGVSLNQDLHHATSCLDPKRQWSNIQQQHVLHILTSLAGNDGRLHSCSICYSFIWIDRFAQLLSIEEGFDEFLDLWNSS